MSAFYIASKLFTYLVLPPGIFILLLFFASFYAKKFKAFFFLCALLFYALSTSYVSQWLLAPLEKPFNQKIEKQKVDAVVVLSGGSMQGVANLPLATDAYKRAMWGVMLAKSNNLPLLFSGAGFGKYSEADAFLDTMKEIENFLHVKIPNAATLSLEGFSLFVENKSLNTYENAKFSKELFSKLNIEKPKIYLVTSAYHMKRSIKLYEHFGFEVIPAATDFKLDTKEKKFAYLPNIGAFNNSYRALHEYVGIASLVLKKIY